MYPILFKIGPFTVYSYGLMVGIAFIVANYLLTKEFERLKLAKNLSNEITLLAIVFGIAGAKLFSLFENWSEFLSNPLIAFSPGGLTFFGGLIFAIIAIWIFLKRKNIPFFLVADAVSPALILAYGIGRIGCQLSGDGDYGIPTNLPWGTNFSNGTVPPTVMFKGFNFHKYFPNLSQQFPNGVLNNTPLQPTPIYEFIAAVIIFLILWKLRTKEWVLGKLFMLYLILAGLERFLIEFIRLNPRILFGFTEAQLIAIVMIIAGSIGWYILGKKETVK